MPVEKFSLDPVDIGSGLVATDVWMTSSPIVLVETRATNGSELKSRLDLQKRMFIDPLPGERDRDGLLRRDHRSADRARLERLVRRRRE